MDIYKEMNVTHISTFSEMSYSVCVRSFSWKHGKHCKHPKRTFKKIYIKSEPTTKSITCTDTSFFCSILHMRVFNILQELGGFTNI